MAELRAGASILLGLVASVAGATSNGPALLKVLPDGTRTLFTTQVLREGAPVWAQFPDAQGRPRCCVSSKVVARRQSPQPISDQLDERQVLAYALPRAAPSQRIPFIGAAWTGPAKSSIRKPMPTVCTSNEGAHLLLLERGRPKAHLYMYFGYDVEPTCDERLLARFE
ncbi:hypothetical protein [Pseudacidovorax intermedius]|uniref:hypothetical protein n=1 Tax=Pseudacidovorax intermedius TaxID=433924 RepID=UPI0005C28A7D|nr:hypothetical protein [Pseudacidovorax intermedius]